MHILITGHTGFKGSWLSLLLDSLGQKVSGYSLNPEPESHFQISKVNELMVNDFREDIRDKTALQNALQKTKPDFIFHLAAQPFVKEGYRKPDYTYEVNVNGTLNILSASQSLPTLKGILVVTTDKVYANSNENNKPFSESDPLGFSDPYSTSKAMADLLTQSWMVNSKNLTVGVARAGNVIGGGDFGTDRLIPDLIRNTKLGKETLIRYPKAVRPWQHVLDCIFGYVIQMNDILKGNSDVFNFGPDFSQYFEVERVATEFLVNLGKGSWKLDNDQHLHEGNFLTLDSRKAASKLNWSNKYDFHNSLKVTADWYKEYLEGSDLAKFSKLQVESYLAR